MNNNLKRIIAVIAVLALAITVFACGKPQNNPPTATDAALTTEAILTTEAPTAATTVPEETTAVSETAALLQAYYDDNYNSANSGRAIRDFNGDGQDEMLVASYIASPTHMMVDYSLLYFKVSNGAVTEADRFSGADVETDGFPAADETIVDPSLFSGAPDGAEELTVHVSGSGHIACLFYYKMNNWSVSYLILSVKDDKLTVEQHLWDPGYTSGMGLYTYDSYFGSENKPEKLFETDWTDVDADSRYDSYWAALEGELGGYGFTFEQYRETGDPGSFTQKGQVADGATPVLDYKNF